MTERQVHSRSSCVLLGCRRWSTRFKADWICAEHWRLVPRDLKLLRAALRRRWSRRWEQAKALNDLAWDVLADATATQPDMQATAWWERVESGWAPGELVWAHVKAAGAWAIASHVWRRGEDAVWRRMKRAAIERAAGL